MKTIEIVPTDGGWMMRSDVVDNTLFFRSAVSAESAAIRLAQGLSSGGEVTRVDILDGNGSRVKSFAIPALRIVWP